MNDARPQGLSRGAEKMNDSPEDAAQVRSATAADEVAVIVLWRACNLVVSHNDPAADFRFARAGAASDVLVGEDRAGRIVGSVMVGHDGHRGWLYYLAADPSRRKRGIGRRMVEAAERWLAGRGIVKIRLMVRETNQGVTAFYERFGYAPAPVTVLQKNLTAPPDLG